MTNAYFEEVEAVTDRLNDFRKWEYYGWVPVAEAYAQTDGYEIDDTLLGDDTARHPVREYLVRKYAWAIPNDEAIRALVDYGPILEVGAGGGYWASLVDAAGGNIYATDINPPDDPWYPVTEHDHTIAQVAAPSETLFLCWPSLNGEWAVDALELYEGDTVIYVGEGRGGCNATDAFFELLNDEYELVDSVSIPQWAGVHDDLDVLQR